MRPNEAFSGRRHAHHVCKTCSKLGPDELAYRQAVRNFDRLLRDGGSIPSRHRPAAEKFLVHPSERVREYAREALAASDGRHWAAQEYAREIDGVDAELDGLIE
jgi:hypothetical protein